MPKQKSIVVDGVTYMPEGSSKAKSLEGMEYKIVRTYSAGVFAGYIKSRDGQEVVIRNARRLYYWDGAASLSQLAEEGVSKPENCKFTVEVEKEILLQVIEILDVTEEAQECIKNVPVWKA